MESAEILTHPLSPDTGVEDDTEDIYEDQPVSLPPIDILITTPMAEEEQDLEDLEQPNNEGIQHESQLAAQLEDERWEIDEHPPCSFYQQQEW